MNVKKDNNSVAKIIASAGLYADMSAVNVNVNVNNNGDDCQESSSAITKLKPPQSTYADYAIPPIYRDSINSIQLTLFDLAKKAIEIAEQVELEVPGSFDRDKTDVIYCTAFGHNRAYENFNRLYSRYFIADCLDGISTKEKISVLSAVKEHLEDHLIGSSHDKVGEMASTIPARIAARFKLRGRAFAVESDDLSGYEGLSSALDALRLKKATSVLLISAQKIESQFFVKTMERLGYGVDLSKKSSSSLCEGATAIILSAKVDSNNKEIKISKSIYITAVDLYPETVQELETLVGATNSSSDAIYIDINSRLLTQGAVSKLIQLVPQATLGSVEKRIGCGYANSVLAAISCIDGFINNEAIPSEVLLSTASTICARGIKKAIILGESVQGKIYKIELTQEPHLPIKRSDDSLELDVSIVGMGAKFGVSQGLDEFWTGLTDDKGSIRKINNEQYLSDLYSEESVGPIGSYYLNSASTFSEVSDLGDDSYCDVKCVEAAKVSMKESLEGLIFNEEDRVLSVVATNLTTLQEKKAVFFEFVPTLNKVLSDVLSSHGYDGEIIFKITNRVCEKAKLSDLSDNNIFSGSSIARLPSTLNLIKTNYFESLALESACAGSIAAIDVAVNALLVGRVDVAIVTGVEAPANINDFCLCSSQRMLAPDLIAVFSARATGFTPGNGSGTLVLRRKQDTIERQISYANIVSIGSCTWSKSVIAPNVEGQVEAMRRAFENAKFSSSSVDFVESHGTGTKIGDEVEIEALACVYSKRNNPLYIGALKTRYGHMFAAAGVASIIKTALIMKNRVIPKNILKENASPSLHLDERKIDILYSSKNIASNQQPLKFGVNSFGTGGVNYHVLLESNITTSNNS